MAITEDASTPAVATGTGSTTTITSAAFTPPANSLLVALVGGGWGTSGNTGATISDSVGGTWTVGPSAANTASPGGIAKIFTRQLSSAPGSMTVTATFTNLSAGRILAVRVLNGAAATQTGAGTGSQVNSTATSAGTVSVTTTVANSVVYGISDDANNNDTYTVNTATTALSTFNDPSPDLVTMVAWKSTNPTSTPGATTFGGTWSVSTAKSNIVGLEILPSTGQTGSVALSGAGALTAAATGTLVASASLAGAAALNATILSSVVVFPNTRRDIQVELFVNGGWVDVSTDVYARDGISITRGARDETSRAEPSRCQLTLNNRSGKYSPRNPNGPYYGSVGRNTPLRVAVGKDIDTFTRTVSNGWGSTNKGNPWSTFSVGGTILASDYNVGSGVGTHSVPVSTADRNTYLGGQSYGDVEVSVTFSLALSSITGGVVAPANLLFRGQDVNNYILIWLYASDVDGHYHLDTYDYIAGVFTSTGGGNTDTGVAYAPNTQVTIRAQLEGPIVRANIWPASGTEPYGWMKVGASSISAPGWVGIQSYIDTPNTNTKPVIFSYDNLSVRIPRYAGEISYWPQRWDVSGVDVFVPVEASGIKRRLGQGTAPVNSAMFTSMTTLATPAIAYWPCEDGPASTQISPAIGGNRMSVVGSTKFANFNQFACSQPLPTLNVSTWSARVPPYTSSGSMSLTYLLHVPTSDPPDGPGAGWPISQIFTDGNAPQYEVKWRHGGNVQVNIWSPSGILLDSGPLAPFSGQTLIDTLWAVCFRVTQNGSNIDWMLSMEQPGSTIAQFWSSTLTGRTMGKATRVVIDPYQQMKDVTVGHITLRNETISVVDRPISYGLNAFSGPPELGGTTAGNRILVLANDASVPLDVRGDPALTASVGPQRPLPLLTLLEESADADMGVLHEVRNAFGLVYRTRRSMYNQTARLSLNYTGGQVAPPLEPVDDDQNTRNDVIAKRTDGGSFELFLSAGRLSITDPWSGGVGKYTDSPELNVNFDTQLPDVAGWRLLLGTVNEARYPTISVNLASPNVVAAGLENAAMTVDVGDRIVITNPFTGSTPDPISQIVRGYTETLNVFEHTISFICAPASPYEVLQSDTVGKATVDSGASSLVSSVTTTATSWSVATTTGNALWITGAVSFDLLVEGERVTVTNISGTSSPQTFTVTRSVNGIVKAHAAGVAVGLFRPTLVGL